MIVNANEGYILYQKEVGWSWDIMIVDNEDQVEQIPISEITREHEWWASPGYKLIPIGFLNSELENMNDNKMAYINEEFPMTHFVEVKIKEENNHD